MGEEIKRKGRNYKITDLILIFPHRVSEKASMRHRCPINPVRARVYETQIECETRRHASILDSSESLHNAARERGALFTIESGLSDETSSKGGSDDANWFRSIPRFPVVDVEAREGRIGARYLARKASWFRDCTTPVYVRADPVTQLLLRLRNKWRDYCFTILSLGALERGLWLRENI